MVKRTFSREFKLAAVRRLADGERVHVLARELGVQAQSLHHWLDRFREGGAAALRPDGRPTNAERAAMQRSEASGRGSRAMPPADPPDALDLARARIVELERKIGRQELELDFFEQALRHVEEARRPNVVRGGTRSTRSSR
jgi:transposase-like protein